MGWVRGCFFDGGGGGGGGGLAGWSWVGVDDGAEALEEHACATVVDAVGGDALEDFDMASWTARRSVGSGRSSSKSTLRARRELEGIAGDGVAAVVVVVAEGLAAQGMAAAAMTVGKDVAAVVGLGLLVAG